MMGFPADETFYSNPTRTHPKENNMGIPSNTDLLNATDNQGFTVGERLYSAVYAELETVLDEKKFNLDVMADEMADILVDYISTVDLTTLAYDKEA